MALLVSTVTGFTFPRTTILSSMNRSPSSIISVDASPGEEAEKPTSISRREASATLAALLAIPFMPSASLAGAPVGEGGLPEGARQFDSVIRVQRDWSKIAKRVKEGGLADEEWKNIQLFLRRLYTASDDMAGMSRGLSASAQAEAKDLIKAFKENVKAADAPAVAKDADGLLAAYTKTNGQLDKFLAYFQDVPDEL